MIKTDEQIKSIIMLKKMEKELQAMAEADEAVVSMLMKTNLPQDLHNEIGYNLEKMRKEFDKLENEYYDLKIKIRSCKKWIKKNNSYYLQNILPAQKKDQKPMQ